MSLFIIHSTHPECLHDGRMVAPGAEVELTNEEQSDPHNQELLERGVLVSGETHSEIDDEWKEE